MSGSLILQPWRETIQPHWIDYNGHLTEAFYVFVFGHATDHVMAQTGMTLADIEASGTSLFTVEAHVRYLQEVNGLIELEVRSSIIGRTAKLVWIWHEMRVASDLLATEEVLMAHVDTNAGRSAPMPDELLARFDQLLVEPPDGAGRAISLGRSSHRPKSS